MTTVATSIRKENLTRKKGGIKKGGRERRGEESEKETEEIGKGSGNRRQWVSRREKRVRGERKER